MGLPLPSGRGWIPCAFDFVASEAAQSDKSCGHPPTLSISVMGAASGGTSAAASSSAAVVRALVLDKSDLNTELIEPHMGHTWTGT